MKGKRANKKWTQDMYLSLCEGFSYFNRQHCWTQIKERNLREFENIDPSVLARHAKDIGLLNCESNEEIDEIKTKITEHKLPLKGARLDHTNPRFVGNYCFFIFKEGMHKMIKKFKKNIMKKKMNLHNQKKNKRDKILWKKTTQLFYFLLLNQLNNSIIH
jgi:hypothetical protein